MALVDCVDSSLRGGGRRDVDNRRGIGGCAAEFATRNPNSPSGFVDDVQYTEKGHVFGPYVAIDFVDTLDRNGRAAITVSNQSSFGTEPKHCAVIKSFELGYSDGTKCRVVIHDTHGGSFESFMQHLVKDWLCMEKVNPTNLLMKVWFGWAKEGCGVSHPASVSPCYYIMVDSIETNFSEGKFNFEVTGVDLCHRTFEGGVEWCGGKEGADGMHLLEAIETVMQSTVAPNIAKVSFKRAHQGEIMQAPDHEMWRANTLEERKRGPKNKWDTKGLSKLIAIKEWLDDFPSINGRGWTPQYDSTVPGGELIYWEKPDPNCRNMPGSYWDETSLGTYIVNGGKDSPVLEFNPKIRWDFSSLVSVGGNIGTHRMAAIGTEGAKNPGHPCMPRESVDGAGQVTEVQVSDASLDIKGDGAEADQAASEAEAKRSMKLSFDGIEADLVIVGDPTMCPPFEAIMIKNVTIVFINPFHIVENSGDSECGVWLATPECNRVLSNKAWICKSITHRIEAGKYTTTIGLYLTSPGQHFPANGNLGGWDGGWTPIHCQRS